MVKRWFYGQRRNCLKKEVWCGYQSSEAIKGCSKISCLWDQVAKNTSDHLIFFLCFKSVLRVCFSCWRFHGWPWQNTTSLKTKNPPKNVLIGVSQQEVTIRIHKIIIDPPKNSPFVNFCNPPTKSPPHARSLERVQGIAPHRLPREDWWSYTHPKFN